MTVVVGLCCDEGAVVASDSQMTATDTRRWGTKVWKVPTGDFVFGAAGNESSMHLLRDKMLGLRFRTATSGAIRKDFADAVKVVLEPEYARTRALSADPNHLPAAEIVLAAYADGQPHIFHANALAVVTDHSPRGFASCGTGAAFAEHAITVFRELRKGLSLHQTKILAFRIIQDAIAAAGPNVKVGGPVQMATVSRREGVVAVELLPDDDPETQDAVDGWVRLEAEWFRDHAPPGPSPASSSQQG